MPVDRTPYRTASRITRPQRVLLVLAALMLLLQLVCLANHTHAYDDDHLDCASCQLIQHLPGGVPPAVVKVAVAPVLLLYRVLHVGAPVRMARISFLIPDSQAPPAGPSFR